MKFSRFITFIVVMGLWALWITGCSLERPKVYRIARDRTWFPLSLMGRERNLLAFSDDIMWEVAKRKGFKVTMVFTGPQNVESGLFNKEFDAVMTSLQPDAFRKQYYSFSDPYFFTGPILIVPTDSKVEKLGSLDNKRVGVRRGTLEHYKINMDENTNVIYVLFENMITAIEMMLRGELEAVIMDLVPAKSFANGIYRGKLKVVGNPLTTAGVRLVSLREDNGTLIDAFDEELKEMRDDGTYRKLQRKWGLLDDE